MRFAICSIGTGFASRTLAQEIQQIRRMPVSQRKPFQEATSSKPQLRQRADKRRELRHTITLPVRVAGADRHKAPWSESTQTLNVSSGGLALVLSKKVTPGDILFVELQLPARFQRNPDPSETYKSYALVRYVEMRTSGQQLARLQFLRRPADLPAAPASCQLVEATSK